MAALVTVPLGLGRAGTTGSSQLLLSVPEAAQLEVRGPEVIVKIRLDRGVRAQLWSGADCNLLAPHATSFTASGTYTVSTSFAAAEDVVVCLATSDQRLHAQASLR